MGKKVRETERSEEKRQTNRQEKVVFDADLRPNRRPED